jgi:hypothetical protein
MHMPSPFPGMDPWLESPDIWPDFHNRFATGLSAWLNRRLPKPYYARLEMRPEVGVVEDEGGYERRIVPDVSVVRRPGGDTAVALADPAVRAISDSFEVTVFSETGNHAFVEIRDPSQGHHLITLIEIVSPANKNPGPDRDAYLKKQAEVLGSDANLIEIDLLRDGRRTFDAPELMAILANTAKKPDYVILLNRASKRAANHAAYQVFASVMTDPLPCIPLPLRDGKPEIAVDLQHIFQNVYDDGPYAQGAINYAKPPVPALPSGLTNWAQDCLRKATSPKA